MTLLLFVCCHCSSVIYIFSSICGAVAELEWKVIYVGSAEDEKKDQELECVLVGPVVVGKNKFLLEVCSVVCGLCLCCFSFQIFKILFLCFFVLFSNFQDLSFCICVQAPAPDPSKIEAKDLTEVTVLLITCSYRDHEFLRVG